MTNAFLNEVFVIVVQLSIAGGIGGIFFLLFSQLLYRLTSAKVVVWFNIAILFLFVIPIYKSGEFLDSSIQKFLQDNIVVLVEKSTVGETVYTVLEDTFVGDGLAWVWLVGILVYLGIVVVRVKKQRYFLQHKTYSLAGSAWERDFHRLCEELPQKRKISIRGVYRDSYVKNICIMGVRERYILIPATREMTESQNTRECALRHELTHSKRNDVPLKFFVYVLICFNWFNPIVYLLKNALNTWTELGCDEDITAGYTKEQKDRYVAAILEVTKADIRDAERSKVKWFMANFAESGDNREIRSLKRRIRGIMRKRTKITALRKVAAFGLMFGIMFTSSVAAKSADVPVNGLFSNNARVMYVEDFMNPSDAIEAENELELISDDELENIILLEDIQDSTVIYGIPEETGTKHLHKYESTKIGEHKKASDGSCTMTIFYADYCEGCDTYWITGVSSEHTYKKCPH